MHRLIRIVGVCGALLPIAAYPAVHARLTLASDYAHRGVAQSDDRPVYQALLDVEGASGLYAGVWLSRVDYPFDRRERELDYFAGYVARPTTGIAVDLGVVRYTYDHHAFGRDYDWSEVQLTAHVLDRWSFMAATADDWLGRGEKSYVVEAGYRHPLPWRLVADVTLGWQHADDVLGQRYHYTEVGVSRAIGPFDLRVGATGTEGAELPADLGQTQWILSVSWLPLAH